MATIKTRPTGDDVSAFLDSVADTGRRDDSHALRALFDRVTGAPPVGDVDRSVLEQLIRNAWEHAPAT